MLHARLEHPPRPVQGFHKKDELQLLVQRRSSAKPLAGVRIIDKTGPLAEQVAKRAAELQDALCEQDAATDERLAAIEDSLCELDAAVNK